MGLLNRLGIRLDGHAWANLLKNFSPIAGAVLGGPGGMMLAGGMSAAGDLGREKKVGVGSAITNAGLAGGLSALKGAFVPSSGMQYGASDVLKGAAMEGKDALLHGAKSLGQQAMKNPLVVGQIAGGVLDARQNSQALDFQKQQYTDRERRRQQLQQMLQPLLSSYAPGGM
jgi:hypothetical protein